MFRWYVINTYSGHENKVKANLEHRIDSMGQRPRFRRVVVPTEQVIETKDGQKVQAEKRVLPGYVLVNMDLNDDAWTVVKNTPGVTGFVGAGNKPIPLSQPEVDRILHTGTATAERARTLVEFALGEQVKVTSGPLSDFDGEIVDVNPDQQLSGTLMLPHCTGREMRVAVLAEGDKAREAQEAGADIVGTADLAKKIEEGDIDFDVAIATPDQMGVVGRLGRILGPRGLMPNPKTGTVTMDVAKAVSDAKAGKLEYRTDRGANVHVAIGKKSFGERQLVENYAALVDEIVRAKPAAAKGRYIRGVTLASTMGPGIKVDPARTRGIAEELEEQAETVNA